MEEKKNKGLQIRDKKRAKHSQNIRKIKDDQVGLCRFVWVEYLIFKQVRGRTRPYKTVGNLGLQIENKVFLDDGRYKFVNNKHLHIKKIYDHVPWEASEKQVELFKKYHEE